MTEKRKKKRKVRKRDWSENYDTAFTHDLKRHLRTDTALSDNAPQSDIPEDFEPNGIVLGHSKKWAFVALDGEEVQCRISRHILEGESTVLTPGDEVYVETWEDEPWVMALKPRRTRLSRPAIEGSRISEQVFAANVDLLIIVVSALKPRIKLGLIDRYLIAAERGGVDTVLCINKMDLVDSEPEAASLYRELGVPIVLTSCETGDGLGELREFFRNRLTVLSGQSGVGKSSLLNELFPNLELVTQEVSTQSEKGRHTTTAARLFTLEDDIRVIDTPGIRQLGLWGVSSEELDYYFPDFAEFAGECRFRNCTHLHEPDCAVQAAVATGQIAEVRFRSYQRIRENLEESESY